MKHILLLFCTFVMLFEAPGCAAPSAFGDFSKNATSKDIQALTQDFFQNQHPIGLTVAIFKNGETAAYCYGKTEKGGADIAPVTLFEIASLTKLFTCSMLADMQQEGLLKLDDSAQKYIGSRVRLPSYEGREIRLADLAAHTSGLPKVPVNIFKGREKDIMKDENPYAVYNTEMMYQDLVAEKLFDPPGTVYQYSNYGMGLLGHILTLIDQKTYQQMLQDRICSKLGMKNTVVTLNDSQKRMLASGHSVTGRKVSAWDFLVLEGAGAIKSNAEDMTRFIAANLGYNPSSLTPALEQTQHIVFEGQGGRIALGWHTAQGRHLIYTHNGETGGYTSYIGMVKEAKCGVFIACNTKLDVEGLGKKIIELLDK
jgi:D-alanyl-D-alanine-carboxypeptidase/D-alanyl-D-alanine-endopeptidase